MARTRLNPQLAKLHRSYTVEELARLYDLHRNTVRAWINRDGMSTIDDARPILIQGKAVRGFLEARRAAAKRPCPPGTLYCFGCRAPRPPALGMADFLAKPQAAGNLNALCDTCGSTMHRRACLSDLPLILPGVEVRIMQDPLRIAECTSPSLKRA